MMVKVVWFLRKAPHLSLDEFHDWWLNSHAPLIAQKQGRMIARYVVNVRAGRDDLPAGTGTPFDWDGMAEEWFASEADARRAFSLPAAPETRADVMAHVSAMSRLIVSEYVVLDWPAARGDPG
jgi:uncharacterized protein (TIGR02118 family)